MVESDDTAPAKSRTSWWRRVVGAVSPDIAVYCLSLGISVGGVLLQSFSPAARERGIGVLVFVSGGLLALARLLLQRLSASAAATTKATADLATTLNTRVDDLTARLRLAPGSLAEDPSLSPIASKLWGTAVENHHKVYEAISGGSMVISGSERAVHYLRLLTEEATRSLHAVDHVAPARWFSHAQLGEYLAFQLARVKTDNISLERIRLVSATQLEDPDSRAALVRLVEAHEAAGATLLLCLDTAARSMGTDFFPAKGALIVDRDFLPACLTGRVGNDGDIENATIYLKMIGPARTTLDEYELIAKRIRRDNLDATIRADLGIPSAAA